MVTVRRLLVASAVAPLALAAPLFFFAFAMLSPSSGWLGPNSSLASVSPLLFASGAALLLYAILVVVYATVAMLLRSVGALSRRSLFVFGAFVSAAIGLWLSCDWAASCSMLGVLQGLVIQGCICGVALIWWRAAMGTFHGASENAASREA
jgi:hypothetical protein